MTFAQSDQSKVYEPLPIATIVRFVNVYTRQRPALELYLTGPVAIHELLTPYRHGLRADRELASTIVESLDLLGASLTDLLTLPPDLGERVRRNALGVSEYVAQVEHVQREYSILFDEETSHAQSGDRQSARWTRLSAFADELERFATMARSSQRAIEFEYQVIWATLAEVGFSGVDVQAAVASLQS
jgi:hypothetical protein